MNLSFKIAHRYLFAKKSTNAINIISGVSVLGLSLGAAALILVLSVFNGFEKLITHMMSNFNPDIKITAKKGKTFVADTLIFNQLRQLEGVSNISMTLEETAVFEYQKVQDFGILKGVDDAFSKVNGLDTTVHDGQYKLYDGERNYAVLGIGISNKLGVYEKDIMTPLSIYMPKRTEVGPLEKPFRKEYVYPVGAFAIQQEFDNQYVIVPLQFLQDILDAPDEASAWELKLNKNINSEATIAQIKNIVGQDFEVKNRYQQEEGFLKLMNIEKWMSFAILSLTILLVAFNMVGSLWMIVLEKKKDISILKSMGATNKLIRNIFMNEGFLLCTLGIIAGFALAVILYLIHLYPFEMNTILFSSGVVLLVICYFLEVFKGKSYAFFKKINVLEIAALICFTLSAVTTTFFMNGIIPLPIGFAMDRYPVALKWSDFVLVAITVVVIGFLASLPASLRAMRVETFTREE